MTDPIPTVHEAWSAVMGAIQNIGKEKSDGLRYEFRGIEATMNAFGPVLREHKVAVIPSKATLEWRTLTSGQKNTAMLEAFVTSTYKVYGPAGDFFEMETIGQASDASDKAVAQAQSVALRIALLQGACVPTGDPEPDTLHIDRSAEDDVAKAGGWQDAAQRDAVWNAVLATAQALPQDYHDAIVLPWAKEVKLDPSTFTVSLSEDWKAKIAEAAKAKAQEDTDRQEVVGGQEAETPPPSSPAASPQEPGPAGTTAGTSAPSDGFDAEAAYADLNEQMRKLGSKDAQKIEKWLEEQKIISPEELTKNLAAEWFAMLSDVLGAAVSEETPTARPWKSKAEAKRTFESLLSRQQALPDALEADVIAWGREHGVKIDLDPQVAVDWQAKIIEAEFEAEAPFN